MFCVWLGCWFDIMNKLMSPFKHTVLFVPGPLSVLFCGQTEYSLEVCFDFSCLL